MYHFVPIVEGQGEIAAVPRLIYRLSEHFGNQEYIGINPPIRIKSGSLLNDANYFKKYISLAAAKASQSDGVVLIFLDSEDYCPAKLGPDLLARAKLVRPDVDYHIILAYREFETWFITGFDSLRGHLGLSLNLERPQNIEGIRDAKGWLAGRMNVKYDPVSHQDTFTRLFNIDQARESRSFDRLCRIISQCLNIGS